MPGSTCPWNNSPEHLWLGWHHLDIETLALAAPLRNTYMCNVDLGDII